MGSYLATFRTAKGELKSITVNASDPISARRYLRRRGIKTLEFKNTTQSVETTGVNREKEFIATFKDDQGVVQTTTVKAEDKTKARRLLRRRGIKPEDIQPATLQKANQTSTKQTRQPFEEKSPKKNDESSENQNLLSTDLGKLFEKAPGVKEKAVWASKLSALVDAGVPIVRSLDLMATQQKLPMFKKALLHVSFEVNQGVAMGAAMRQIPKVFDQLTIAMIEAGEAGGVLDESLKRLAKLLEDNAKLQNQIKGALGYPVAVLVIAILVFLGMTIFLIPTFAGIFEDLGAELPAFTQLLVNFSELLRSPTALYFVGIIILSVWLFLRYYNTHDGRRQVDRLVLKLPLFGELIMMTATAQFCRIFSSLTRAGVPILMSLEISSDTAGNSIISDAILESRALVQEGVLLSTALMRQKVLPDMALNMLSIGEETGEMDKMLSKVADFYEDEVGAMVKALTSMLEPAMIVVVGGIVGSILLAMYLPMFTVFDQIQ
jgi:type IV pilus assembly protein PilC